VYINVGRSRFWGSILQNAEIVEVAAKVNGLEKPVYIRTHDTDQIVFQKIFLENEYRPRDPVEPRWILDAGANVGYATLWFTAQYPSAQIIALEPNPANFERLKFNCGHLRNVQLIHGALWREDGELVLQMEADGKSLQSWGTRTVAATEGGETRTQCFSIDSIMAQYGVDHFGFVKVDIEGAEKEVFEAKDAKWIGKSDLLAIEVHDSFKPGSSAAVEAALAGRYRSKYRKGENLFYELGT